MIQGLRFAPPWLPSSAPSALSAITLVDSPAWATFFRAFGAVARDALGNWSLMALNLPEVRKDALRLMIVDDEEAARYGMRRALTTLGYNITEAGSAEAARALLKQNEPDLLLLDVNLPGMSGLDFLRELKSANGNAPLVIIVTAHGSERMAVEAVKAGAHDYLSKPFEVDDLRLV